MSADSSTLERPTRRVPHRRPTGEPDAVRLRPAGRGRRVRLPELVLGVLLVGAGALASVWWWTSSNTAVPVAVLARPLAAGEVIGEDDLRPVDARLGAGARAVSWAQRDDLVGQRALAAMPAGTVLVAGLVGEQPALASGEALVGLKLGPGGFPFGNLAVGDAVAVVAAPAGEATGSSAAVVADNAVVWAVTEVTDAEATVLVTLRLDESLAAQVSAQADQVRLVRVVR